MRKSIKIMLIIALLLSGCSKKSNPVPDAKPDTSKVEETQEEVKEETKNEETAASDEASEDDAEKEKVEAVSITINLKENVDSKLYSLLTQMAEEIASDNVNLAVTIKAGSDALSAEKELTQIEKHKIDMIFLNRKELEAQNIFLSMFDGWFTLVNYEHYRAVMEDKVGEAMFADILNNTGLKVMGTLYQDSSAIILRDYEIAEMEDFYPVKLGVNSSELGIGQANALGANPVVYVPKYTYRYLAEHTIDGLDTYLEDIRAKRYYEICDVLLNTDHQMDFDFILMDPQKWSSLNARQKDSLLRGIQHVIKAYDKSRLSDKEDLLALYEGMNMRIEEIDKAEYFLTFAALYRGNVAYTTKWNMEYYERILRLALSILDIKSNGESNEPEEEDPDHVISGE